MRAGAGRYTAIQMAGMRDGMPGVSKAWEALRVRGPAVVASGAGAKYEQETSSYMVESMGQCYRVRASDRSIKSIDRNGRSLSEIEEYFFQHALIWYLAFAEDFPETGRLVRPEGMRGGANFFTGAHALPLTEIADRYNADRGKLLERGLFLGGAQGGYGDEAVTVRPLPRVTATILIWYSDDESEARADLLFDSSIEIRLPLDVVWSVAMMTTLAFL